MVYIQALPGVYHLPGIYSDSMPIPQNKEVGIRTPTQNSLLFGLALCKGGRVDAMQRSAAVLSARWQARPHPQKLRPRLVCFFRVHTYLVVHREFQLFFSPCLSFLSVHMLMLCLLHSYIVVFSMRADRERYRFTPGASDRRQVLVAVASWYTSCLGVVASWW